MAKSARSSAVKKNKSKLKSRLFGPVEQARSERLSQRLLELAQQAKPRDAAQADAKGEGGNENVDEQIEGTGIGMEVDTGISSEARQPSSNTALKKAKAVKKERIDKKRRRKETNRIAFRKHPMKANKGSKR